ncbi:MAG: zinc ribbon domain-containing protein [Lachnospiraceae bacterium]|nr:zinc ribbon domain-containing protein [Lachnospiraceae bacterium]
MTDEMRAREEAICEAAGIKDIGDLSDGFHTFNQLYYQRMMLFATIVKQNRGRAWKSLRHEDGELCFGGGWFIVGIDTPEGSYTYHYEDNYYSLFDCVELERAKHWDGHTEKDVTRLLSLPVLEKQETAKIVVGKSRGGVTLWHECNKCGEPVDAKDMFCSGCGRKLIPLPEPYTEEDND